jgi:hypothetical protein
MTRTAHAAALLVLLLGPLAAVPAAAQPSAAAASAKGTPAIPPASLAAQLDTTVMTAPPGRAGGLRAARRHHREGLWPDS